MGQNAQHHEKEALEVKVPKSMMSSFQKTKSTQTSELVLADRNEQVERNRVELELIKIKNFFVDGHGNYTCNIVSFRTLCKLTTFWFPERFV